MFQIMPEGNDKPLPGETDPDKLAKLLEIELMQKRAEWQQVAARGKTLRSISFFFLFIVILAAVIGFYLLLSGGLSGSRTNVPDAPNPTTSPGDSEP